MAAIQIIDSHFHFLQPSRFHYHWLKVNSPLNKDFHLADISTEMKTLGVTGGILMEATNTPEEIPWLLEISENDTLHWGVIGWIHLEQPDAAEQIVRYARHPRFKGVRLNWLESRSQISSLDGAMQALSASGLVVDILAGWDYLPEVATFIRNYPQVSFVLEHFGGASITDLPLHEWQNRMKQFAALSNVAVKISAYTSARAHSPAEIALWAYIQAAIDLFSVNRLMFGSNYPIGLSTTSYSETVNLLQNVTADIDENARSALFYDTARQTYHLL